MEIIISRTGEKGCRNEWSAQVLDGDVYAGNIGTGKTRSDALCSLIRANLEWFNIDAWTDIDPLSKNPVTKWSAGA